MRVAWLVAALFVVPASVYVPTSAANNSANMMVGCLENAQYHDGTHNVALLTLSVCSRPRVMRLNCQ